MNADIDIFSFNSDHAREQDAKPDSAPSDADAAEIAADDIATPQAVTDASDYNEDSIQTLEWNEHIRRRPGMYIGKLGDGSHPEDGIYVLLKETVDNSIDEFNSGFGKRIDITVDPEGNVTVRDFGRGIPLGKVREVASEINTGGKFDSKTFQKSVGLNGVGLKAVNALSTFCEVSSFRDGRHVKVEFERGALMSHSDQLPTEEANGTLIKFHPDPELFKGYGFNLDFVETMVNNYTYLNTGLQIFFNGKRYLSRHGLADLLKERLSADPLYPVIHLRATTSRP